MVESLLMSTCKTLPRPGRPRSNQARDAILNSALELLDQVGFAALSIEAIAARAGVGKATVYRWWKHKAEIVMEAFLARVQPELDFPPGEAFEDALRNQLLRVSRIFASKMGPVIGTVIGAGQSEPELLRAFYTSWIEPRRAQARKMLQEAMDRGEVRDDVPPDIILDLLYGAMYFRLLVRRDRIDRAFAEAVGNVVMDGSIRGQKTNKRSKAPSLA